MLEKTPISERRDYICDHEGEIAYTETLIDRLENKESRDVFKEAIAAAQLLSEELQKAECILRDRENKTINNLYQIGESGDISVFEPSPLRQCQANHHNFESA